ncbi:hypothetical protein D9758_015470 [Tetrapyrgos nigripes]|uniref:BTB domain-containing protein n=1 Tax=Tetrapyrgos nigripes TaxID=182062 RepID=A0A8H5CMG6_9AGAR|nr:hypothetical protein D9758_015470 [Tetrapyrgos nigripes]
MASDALEIPDASNIVTLDGTEAGCENDMIRCEASDNCSLPIDIILRSSSDPLTRFGTHKLNLQIYSSILSLAPPSNEPASPGITKDPSTTRSDVSSTTSDANSTLQTASFNPTDESKDVYLPEDPDVIQLLLKFMHHQPQPDLRLISSNLLLRFANAAEKYKVYCATGVCSVVLEFSVKEHPFDVFLYATNWGYTGLQEVAAKLAMKESPARFFAYAHSINHVAWRDLAEQETHKLPTKQVHDSFKEYCKDSGSWAEAFGAWFNKRESLRTALFTALNNPIPVQHKGGLSHCDEWHSFYPQLLGKMAVEPPCEESFLAILANLKPVLKNCDHCGIVLKAMGRSVRVATTEGVGKRALREFL